MSIWKTLSAIDCSAHTEQKGNFTYLSWTWAWAMVKERYPDAIYHIENDIVYPDGTMEVRCSVTIEGLSHTMWLPVLDFKNKAIQHPNAFDINTSRMRVLVKCLAMFGLGHYIYAGESFPQQEPFTADQRIQFMDLLTNADGWGLKRFANEVGLETITALFNSFGKGEISKNKQVYRDMVGAANSQMKMTLEALRMALVDGSLSSFDEIMSELPEAAVDIVLAGLTEIETAKLFQLKALDAA